nr:response regulator transcription factor [uncultured Gordonia sp.]
MKPFSPGELAARVRSLLRRRGPTTSAPVLQIGRLVIDVVSREVTVSGERVTLTAKEFDLLAFLAQNPRQVFTRHQLLDSVWQTGEWLGEPTVTEHVHRLRTKLRYASTDSLIRTVRGVGYQFDPTSAPS